jgi:hypothetical protein
VAISADIDAKVGSSYVKKNETNLLFSVSSMALQLIDDIRLVHVGGSSLGSKNMT